jgi:cell division septum initiation protein DivIVA
MFNLFPKFKSVSEIQEKVNTLFPSWSWSTIIKDSDGNEVPVNELIQKYNNLIKENQELKNDVHQPELCDEKIKRLEEEIKNWEKDWDKQNKNIIELSKEVKNLRHLKQENADLMEILAKYRDGYQGSCYACEPVGELNQKLELRLTAYQKMVEGASETIDKLKTENFDLKYQKHPMYPIHWGGWNETLENTTKAELKNEDFYKWSTTKVAMDDAIQEKWRKVYGIEKPESYDFCEYPDGELVTRLNKLEKKVEELTIIKYVRS